MMGQRPFSAACDRNKAPILARLKELLPASGEVLEIGGGTGQHAVHFAHHLPGLIWHVSDRPEHHPGIRAWMEWAQLPNLRGPLRLDVNQTQWPLAQVDAVFSANTAHIMHWGEVEKLFAGVGGCLSPGAPFCLYGPFSRGGEHNSASNQAFDASLRARDPGMGIRDLDELDGLAERCGLLLSAVHDLPANNRMLLFRGSETEVNE